MNARLQRHPAPVTVSRRQPASYDRNCKCVVKFRPLICTSVAKKSKMHNFRYRTEHYNNAQGAHRSTKVDSSMKVVFSSKCRDQNKLVRDGH
jgi:hypothetical protein